MLAEVKDLDGEVCFMTSTKIELLITWAFRAICAAKRLLARCYADKEAVYAVPDL